MGNRLSCVSVQPSQVDEIIILTWESAKYDGKESIRRWNRAVQHTLIIEGRPWAAIPNGGHQHFGACLGSG